MRHNKTKVKLSEATDCGGRRQPSLLDREMGGVAYKIAFTNFHLESSPLFKAWLRHWLNLERFCLLCLHTPRVRADDCEGFDCEGFDCKLLILPQTIVCDPTQPISIRLEKYPRPSISRHLTWIYPRDREDARSFTNCYKTNSEFLTISRAIDFFPAIDRNVQWKSIYPSVIYSLTWCWSSQLYYMWKITIRFLRRGTIPNNTGLELEK